MTGTLKFQLMRIREIRLEDLGYFNYFKKLKQYKKKSYYNNKSQIEITQFHHQQLDE